MSAQRKILVVCPALPFNTSHSGAANRYVQNINALVAAGANLRVVRFADATGSGRLSREQACDPGQLCGVAGKDALEYHEVASRPPTGSRFARLWQSLVDPTDFAFGWAADLAPKLKHSVTAWQPDLVWAEGQELALACMHAKLKISCVYSHHDLLHRLRRLRWANTMNFRKRWWLWVCRRAERKLCRTAATIVTGSSTDAERMRNMGAKAVRVVGAACQTPCTERRSPPSSDVRIVHLGGMGTTSNRIGLEAYLRVVHPRLRQAANQARLCIVGDHAEAPVPLLKLLKGANAELCGYVSDLASVLRPYDIALLPYQHDTGYRTKLPVLMAYQQVVVSTITAVAGMQLDGLRKVCCLCENLDEFPVALERLCRDGEERQRLGNAARDYFDSHLSFESTVPEYRSLMTGLFA